MEKLIERHFQATIRRGKINSKTTINDFLNKMVEEDKEVLLEKTAFDLKLENNFVQETIDSIMVRMNMLLKLGVNIKEELEINVKYQETRFN